MARAASSAGGSGGGFGVAARAGVYALAQCWKSLGVRECGACLDKARAEVVNKCWGSREGRSLNAGCYLRYSTRKFYSDGKDEADNGKSEWISLLVVQTEPYHVKRNFFGFFLFLFDFCVFFIQFLCDNKGEAEKGNGGCFFFPNNRAFQQFDWCIC